MSVEDDKIERRKKVENLQLMYPRLNELLRKIKECHEDSRITPEPECLLITGIQGVGKTKLYERYLRDYPRIDEEDVTAVPVLTAIIPAKASVKALSSSLLYSLGDPMAENGTVVQQTFRLQRLLKKCRTELIILDEFQHIIDQDSAKVLRTSADWLKNLLNETEIPIVLIGMPSCTVILDANPQLHRRFSSRRELVPFVWSGPGANNEIQQILKLIEQNLPLREQSNLSDPETAYRIYCGSSGIMHRIMRLIRDSAHKAIASGIERITLDMLAEVYEDRLASNYPSYPNPFETELKQLTPLKAGLLPGELPAKKKASKGRNLYAA